MDKGEEAVVLPAASECEDLQGPGINLAVARGGGSATAANGNFHHHGYGYDKHSNNDTACASSNHSHHNISGHNCTGGHNRRSSTQFDTAWVHDSGACSSNNTHHNNAASRCSARGNHVHRRAGPHRGSSAQGHDAFRGHDGDDNGGQRGGSTAHSSVRDSGQCAAGPAEGGEQQLSLVRRSHLPLRVGQWRPVFHDLGSWVWKRDPSRRVHSYVHLG
mmetsp:Transcript_12129/g.33295  ORF Transcript_12129/g.33295 Transcript_12129/m.33295 type:complete len:218 (+) Transcript_12129:820-1473(+)